MVLFPFSPCGGSGHRSPPHILLVGSRAQRYSSLRDHRSAFPWSYPAQVSTLKWKTCSYKEPSSDCDLIFVHRYPLKRSMVRNKVELSTQQILADAWPAFLLIRVCLLMFHNLLLGRHVTGRPPSPVSEVSVWTTSCSGSKLRKTFLVIASQTPERFQISVSVW